MPRHIDDVHLQQTVIKYIAHHLGEEAFFCFEGCQLKTKLESVLRDAKRLIVPTATTQTLRRWWYHFTKYGDTQAERRHNKKKEQKKGKGYKKKTGRWTKRHHDLLLSIVEDDPDLYLDEIRDELRDLGGGWWSSSYIWNRLSLDCNYSLQVASDRSYAADKEERLEFLQALADRVINPNQLIFLDESQKDRNSSRRRRCWSKKGESPFREAYLASSHSKRYTFLGACDVDGFVIEACTTVEQSHGSDDTNPTRGTISSDRFRMWVEEKLLPLLGNHEKCEPRSIVVMDNASIHNDIKDLIESTGAKLIYTAPYSPDLNPIELMFGSYKAALRRHNKESWDRAHNYGLASVTPDIARAYFRHCKVPQCENFPTQKELAKQKEDYDLLGDTLITGSIGLMSTLLLNKQS